MMKKLVPLIVVLAIGYWGYQQQGAPTGESIGDNRGETRLLEAFENGNSGVQVAGAGRVVRILADDNDGSRHQRFVLELSSGQTVLIAHNIDVAPRINSIREDDLVSFYGVYEWNSQGGVVHWTHHDPAGRHEGGWIEHRGKRYE